MTQIDWDTDMESLLTEKGLISLRRWEVENMSTAQPILETGHETQKGVFNAVIALIGYIDYLSLDGKEPEFDRPLTLENINIQVEKALS